MRECHPPIDPMSEEEIEQKLARLGELARQVNHRVSRTMINEAISELLNEIDNLKIGDG
jgi:uncharacterized coiled-coil DUF342 family protein